MLNERWKPIAGYEGHYEVSNFGNVRSLPRKVLTKGGWTQSHPAKPLRPGRATKSGHLLVVLCKDGVTNGRLVHQLVLETFVGPRPDGMCACHANDIAWDNRLENLRWDTRSSNSRDAVRNGRHRGAGKTHCKRGHEFTTENTYQRPGATSRQCRVCVAITRASKKRESA